MTRWHGDTIIVAKIWQQLAKNDKTWPKNAKLWPNAKSWQKLAKIGKS